MYANAYSDGTLLNVWIQPRASRTAIVGLHADSVKIAIKSPPVEGRANEECIAFLAGVFGLPKRDFEIKSGQQGRRKGIFIRGISPEEVMSVLQGYVGGA